MTKRYKTIDFFDYSVFSDSLKNIEIADQDNLVISTINPHSYVVAKKDNIFKEALMTSDILLPDGIGIVHAVKHFHRKTIKRITGYDLMISVMERLNQSQGKCFFMGSTEKVLKSIKNRVAEEYPNIKVGHYSPPYKTIFNENDNNVILRSIIRFNPDVLFVGMTAPKQEKWVYQNMDKFHADVICSIGAAFDFYAETVNRPSLFWRDIGFEWLARFFKNPTRLWKRNFISIPIFLYDITKKYYQSS